MAFLLALQETIDYTEAIVLALPEAPTTSTVPTTTTPPVVGRPIGAQPIAGSPSYTG